MSDEGTTTDNDNVTEKEVANESESVAQNENDIENQNVIENENDIATTENEDDTSTTTENGNVTKSADGNGDDVENEQSQESESTEIKESVENNEQPPDLFDSLKDTVDGTGDTVATAEEPMEVDEVSNESENETQEKQTETTTINSNAPDEATQNDESSESNEHSAHDENDANSANEQNQKPDEPTEMEVDCETPQGEDVPDFTKKQDDSVMEHNLEEFNCSSLSDTVQKDQTISDDPFDSLLKGNDTNANESTQNDTNMSTTSSMNDGSNDQNDEQHDGSDDQNDVDDNVDDADDHNDADEPAGSDREDDDRDTSSHHDGSTIEAVDDIEEGKGADEELCLLPDEEREISDADKERALQNQQQEDDHDDQENEAGEGTLEGIEENGEKEPTEGQTEGQTEDQESETAQESSEQTQTDMSTIPFTPSVDEIKEIDADLCQENMCMECGQTIKCKYALLKEITPAEGDTETLVRSEIQYLCDTGCVTKFNGANAKYKVVVKKVPVHYAMDIEQNCESCEQTKTCRYRYKETTDADTFNYICDDDCLNNFTTANPDKFTIAKKRFIIEEASGDDLEAENKCLQCFEETKCKYTFKEDEKSFYLCNEPCLNLLMAEQPDRFRFKRQSIRAKDFSRKPVNETIEAPPKRSTATSEKSKKMVARTEDEQRLATIDREASFARRCAQCYSDIMMLESNLQWEALDFCNEACLGQYQQAIGAACQSCQNAVSVASMGKYCVRFGFELRQFCRSACLDAFKKGLKVCSYCQLDITKNDEYLAPINGQFKDFCSRKCSRSYEQIFSNKKHITKTCAVCNNSKAVRVEVVVDSNIHYFCSNPCFSAFSFVNNVNPDCCAMCRKYFERKSSNAHTIYGQGNDAKLFCSKICMNIYIISNRQIAPCQWCKVRKYNFDMIQKVSAQNGTMMLCSINCLSMCEVSMNAIAMKQLKCDQCNSVTTPQYHLTMSDASMRNFCTYQCVMAFQSQFSRAPLTLESEVGDQRTQPVPTGLPKRIRSQQQQKQKQSTQSQVKGKSKSSTNARKTNSYQSGKQPAASNTLVIASVTSLAPTRSTRGRSSQAQNSSLNELNRLQPVVELEPLPETVIEKTTRSVGRPRIQPVEPPASAAPAPQVRVERQTQIVTIPPLPKKVANVATLCAPSTHNKEIQARPMQFTVGCQTDDFLEQKMVIPIPVPIYLPSPLPMYAQPFPVPVPIPLPIPVPVFIPTTRNSANGIMKEIKKIQDKMPADPFEAELLMMAEMVAGDKKKEDDTDSSEEENEYPTEDMPGNNFGEDIMQMALKMATEYDPAGVDLEASMQANTITPHSHPGMQGHDMMHNHQHNQMMMMEEQQRPTRKRGPAPRAQRQPASKRPRRGVVQEPPPPEPTREPIEKADANMCLKFTFGVNAWKQWVITKNSELEKSSMRRKLFKTELLQLTADELNYSLCLFVKEVRKPNGSEYAPDTIYYLVLGIQEYLYENGRIDNIFTDPYYERFTDCLDEVAKKFSVLYNDSQYIVTRVEEEHLWECKQLGAHSPHVLLSTLMFFNTKHFNLTTVEEHMQLSFSHIMKHWKRNPNQGSAKMAGSRNVLLRFYPPQSSLIDNSRKKKVYEQQENEENPLRCPVKLYEFYLSKCPESVKTRNDVFYLLPERSCVPDSPVWYSTQALGKDALAKMLHRVKMVKEINIALLTS